MEALLCFVSSTEKHSAQNYISASEVSHTVSDNS